MEQSQYFKNLPVIFKLLTCVDVKTRHVSLLVVPKILIIVLFLLSTISCFSGRAGSQDAFFSKLHDSIFFSFLLSHEILFLYRKSELIDLVEFLGQPFKIAGDKMNYSCISKWYRKKLKVYYKLVPIIYSIFSVFWYISSSVMSYVTPSDEHEQCVHLAGGWVWSSDYYSYLVLLNLVCIFTSIPGFFIRYLCMFLVVMKIKFKTRLLCADLEDIDRFFKQYKECTRSDRSKGMPELRGLGFQMRERTDANQIEVLQVENIPDVTDLHLERYLAERFHEAIKIHIKNIVEQHLSIIKYVKVIDITYRNPIVSYLQTAVIGLALAIPKLSLSKDLLSPEDLNRWIEVLIILGIILLFSSFGQMVLDESETLRQAFYNCDWTDKPHSLKRSLLIMQTVATKPFRLTVGGIYTLGMETYGNFTSAAYSCTSLLQSLKVSGP